MRSPGPTTTTFTILGRCERTGMLGVAMCTSSIAVGARCPFVRARVGAVATQATTDPRLGPLALRLLELGYSASKVVAELETSDPHIEHRQVGVVDMDGNAAARTGKETLPWAGHIVRRNCVAMGNYLVSERVAEAMAGAFEQSADERLEERLVRAIEAGQAAGGERGGRRSAALLVYDSLPFPAADLRVDEHAEPIRELRRIFDLFKPLIHYYNIRPANPTLPMYEEWLEMEAKKERA